MKRKLLVSILLGLCACLMSTALFACGDKNDAESSQAENSAPSVESNEDSSSDVEEVNGVSFKTLTVDGKNVYGVVSNATETFSFADEVTATGKTKFAVSLDVYGTQTALTKIVPLKEGDNTVYVMEMIDDEVVDTYTVTIRRRPMYTVTFDTAGGTAVESQRIEETYLATEPEEAKKAGCTFDGWDYDFTSPIMENTTITANWKIEEGLEYFNFTSTETTCEITGLKDETVKEIIIPDCVTSIGNFAFSGCDSLASIEIPDSVTSIGDFAFYCCNRLTSVVIGDSVTSIGDSAFYNCYSLTSIEIPDSVTSIGDRAFYYCTSLTNISVSKDNENYQSIDGNLYSKDGKTLIQYAIGKTATSFTIPDSVTSIGNYAFFRCTSLTSIEIPDSVTSIGDYAFYCCNRLTSIEIPDSVMSIGDYAFYCCTSLTNITFAGTVAQWNAITKGDYWKYNVPATKVVCKDGTVSI